MEEIIAEIENGLVLNEKRVIEFIKNKPQYLFHLLLKILEKNSANFFAVYYVLPHLKISEISQLVDKSVELLKVDYNKAADSIIRETADQYPDLLHQYAKELFQIEQKKTYQWNKYLRDLKDFDFLIEIKDDLLNKVLIEAQKSHGILTYLFKKKKDSSLYKSCLGLFSDMLETRSIEAAYIAIEFAKKIDLFNNLGEVYQKRTFIQNVQNYLNDVGFHFENDIVIPLHDRSKAWHFVFEDNYLSSSLDNIHPTFFSNGEDYEFEFEFGGILDTQSEGHLFHIMTLNSIPLDFGITLKKLVLAFDFRYYEKIFYKHDENGIPTLLPLYEIGKEYEVHKIKKTKIRLKKTPSRWYFQERGYGNLNRFGGEPTWINGAYYPKCPETGEIMKFLFQINEIPTENDFLFNDEGVFYFFWCDKSKISTYVFQQT